MPSKTLTEKLMPEDVQRILDQTDWSHYEACCKWGLEIPRCHFYDGELAESQKSICRYWTNWLENGRKLYPVGEEGLRKYLVELKEIVPKDYLKFNHERAEKFLRTGK